MKRSEMVTYMTKLINQFEDCKIDETYTDELLEGMEQLGMLPPWNPIGSEPLEGHIMLCQWDPE